MTIAAGNGSSVTVTTNNTLTRDTGTLSRSPRRLSNPDGASVPASFTINYDCGAGYTGSVSVAAGGSQTVSGIPTGSTCTVTEAALAPISGYTWGTPIVHPQPRSSIGTKDGTFDDHRRQQHHPRPWFAGAGEDPERWAGRLHGGRSRSTITAATGFTGSVSVAAGSSQTVSGIPTGTSAR